MTRLAVTLITLTIGSGVLAQDVEPTLGRAVARIAHQLARDLPFRAAPADALSVRPERGTPAQVVRAVTQGLKQEGFRVEAEGSAPAAGTVLPLVVAARPAGEVTALRLAAATPESYSVECAFGEARWVDDPRQVDGTSRICVEGPVTSSPERALSLARQTLFDRVALRYPRLAARASGQALLAKQPTVSFVAAEGAGDSRLYRAYLATDAGTLRLEQAERAAEAAQARAPFVRLGLGALAALVSWLLYLRADWRTHGYRSGRLRLVFGTLFLALTAGVWSLPL